MEHTELSGKDLELCSTYFEQGHTPKSSTYCSAPCLHPIPATRWDPRNSLLANPKITPQNLPTKWENTASNECIYLFLSGLLKKAENTHNIRGALFLCNNFSAKAIASEF